MLIDVMDELIDILDPEGNFTGKTAMKSEAHQKGWFHPTVHIWLYTKEGQILLQQRSKNKTFYPLLWDVSVAGHIATGESAETAAVRETQEEIGLSITENKLQKIGVFKAIQKHSNTAIDCEFHTVFLSELKVTFNKLQKQNSEVENLKLLPLKQFSEEIAAKTTAKKYVPHTHHYYSTVIENIKQVLERS